MTAALGKVKPGGKWSVGETVTHVNWPWGNRKFLVISKDSRMKVTFLLCNFSVFSNFSTLNV